MKLDKLSHLYGSLKIRLDIYLTEKEHVSDGIKIKYLFHPNKRSKALIVVFPACYENKAQYNYMRTLSSFKCNKLFLLDDFGTNHQGCYLVEDQVEKCCLNLIQSIINRLNGSLDKVFLVGGSKGGYSAINFGLRIPDTIVIAGGPQYYLGRYLDKENTIPNLEFLLHGTINELGIKYLDYRLKNLLYTSTIKPNKIYLHFSDKEHTYEEHVRDLLTDVSSAGIPVITDVLDYKSHSDLATFFPLYLSKILKQELGYL
ncbi:MAG: hypothetical protein J6S89_11120 [Paludibacteraceae bacterium]|nr:hypothetical protein [Paludibacteraceae bacterium]